MCSAFSLIEGRLSPTKFGRESRVDLRPGDAANGLKLIRTAAARGHAASAQLLAPVDAAFAARLERAKSGSAQDQKDIAEIFFYGLEGIENEPKALCRDLRDLAESKGTNPSRNGRSFMHLVLTFFTVTCAFFTSFVFATASEQWTVKSVHCVAGTVDPSKSYQVGSVVSADAVRNLARHSGWDSLEEDENEALLRLNALGGENGTCKNAGVEMTVQIITFTKR